MKEYYEKKSLLYAAQCGRCYGCDEVFAIDDLQIDHILPKHRLGKARKRNQWFVDELFNLRLLCSKCHLFRRPAGFSHDDCVKILEDVLYAPLDAGAWIDDEKLRKHYRHTLVLFRMQKNLDRRDRR